VQKTTKTRCILAVPGKKTRLTRAYIDPIYTFHENTGIAAFTGGCLAAFTKDTKNPSKNQQATGQTLPTAN